MSRTSIQDDRFQVFPLCPADSLPERVARETRKAVAHAQRRNPVHAAWVMSGTFLGLMVTRLLIGVFRGRTSWMEVAIGLGASALAMVLVGVVVSLLITKRAHERAVSALRQEGM